MPDPRDLDKNKTVVVATNETQIVHRHRYVDENGVQQEKVHGPMNISDWPAYEKENGL